MMKDETQLSNKSKWVTVVILTALVSFCLEIFLLLYGTFSKDKDTSDFVPWTFHWFWEIFCLIGIYFIVKKIKISFGNFMASVFIGMIITAVAWLFIPNSLKIIKANYYGVESRLAYDTHEEGRYDEQVVYDFPLRPGFLYRADDAELLKELNESSEYNEYAGTRGFLFWQTGLAYGFIPDRIKEYNGGNTFIDHIELFFIVGPMVLVECLIKGLYSNFFIFLVAQIIWLLIKKEHIWWYKD